MPVPWFIGQAGATHSSEVARRLAYAATGGKRGIASPGDLKILPLATPGTSIRATVGGCSVPNTFAEGQSYVDGLDAQATLAIPATTSSGPRSDMIVWAIRDSQYPGNAVPSNVAQGPYSGLHRIAGVPSTATRLEDLGAQRPAFPCVELARIDIPASTATIQASHIKDLRKLANPQSHREVQYEQVTPANQDLTSAAWVRYPNTEPYFEVPSWATLMFIQFRVLGLAVMNAACEGWARIEYGTMGQTLTPGAARFWDYDNPSNGVSRVDLEVGAAFQIPDTVRGKMQIARLAAQRTSGSGFLRTGGGTQAVIDVQFYERAI